MSKGVKPLTISIGVSTFPYDATDMDKLINRADIALYEAKKTGKNKVCLYAANLGKGFLGFIKKG